MCIRDSPHYAYLDLGHPPYRDGGKLRRDLRHDGLHLPAGIALIVADFIAENVQPLVLQPLRSPSFQLIGLGLGDVYKRQCGACLRRWRNRRRPDMEQTYPRFTPDMKKTDVYKRQPRGRPDQADRF